MVFLFDNLLLVCKAYPTRRSYEIKDKLFMADITIIDHEDPAAGELL